MYDQQGTRTKGPQYYDLMTASGPSKADDVPNHQNSKLECLHPLKEGSELSIIYCRMVSPIKS